ncbi:ATP-dependent 6-phosphofructokinase [Candidatus Paracaedibacter symbiosus]|uniref:ATP-dependent 6-phosphofructokinase n=1 Tax=Candidatus Paracaedibacter symbiosus TaxID=244582 RepID=UPI000509C4CD|nr:ATP-dependent 6-phosphofructokinase [Candidatus Paracaedibacter symbiosus]
MVKRIGVLTSGGDCAGLNAAIRSITHHAITHYGWEVIGIRKGTTGLINRPLEYIPLTIEQCDSAVLRSGGTLLGSTNKDNPFSFPNSDGTRSDHSDDFITAYRELGLDALIGIGGDGSMHILRQLAQKGNINLITIPKTIDNDLGETESAIGYATAVEVATEALDRLQPTAASHQRVMVLEVMGRDAGHIAIASGIAGGADVILVPEIPYKLENIYNKIKKLTDNGRNFALVIVAEAVRDEAGQPAVVSSLGERIRYGGIGHYLGEKIIEATGADVRVMVLGHVQRGGQPNAADRIIAAAFGIHAVDLIAQGKSDRMVAWKHRDIIDVPIQQAIDAYHSLQPTDVLVRTARGLGICLGDQ